MGTMSKISQNYQNEIKNLVLKTDSAQQLQKELVLFHSRDIAQTLGNLDLEMRKKLYRLSTPGILAGVFSYLSLDRALLYINEIDTKKSALVLSELETYAAVDILCEIKQEKRKYLLDSMSVEARKKIQDITAYDEDEAGSRMTPDCVVIAETTSAKDAVKELISHSAKDNMPSAVFLTDDKERFSGVVSLSRLFTSEGETAVKDLAIPSFPCVYAQDSLRSCLDALKDYCEAAIPVLDEEDHILGMITLKTLFRQYTAKSRRLSFHGFRSRS